MFFMARPEISTSQQNRVTMGTRPLIMGMPMSWSGWEARSAISAATTNSDSSISPSCRLPRSRMMSTRAKYIISVRTKTIAISAPRL